MAVHHAIQLVDTFPKPRVLIVDDTPSIRNSLAGLLTARGFDVVTADCVITALNLITSHTFDVLLTDLHMPAPGDGLTVVGAMRNANPKAVALVFSGYPAMNEAASAVLLQADGVLVKPMDAQRLVEEILAHLRRGPSAARTVDSVATILESCAAETIADWLARVDSDPNLITVSLDHNDRSTHLTQLLRDLVLRLRCPLPLGSRGRRSMAAVAHGIVRRRQGYTAVMIVEESRKLQVSIFQTLQNNLYRVNFSLLLIDVMAIADEVDSQLAQTIASYFAESERDAVLPVA